MKKNILFLVIILAGIFILLGAIFFSKIIDPITNTTVRNGKYFETDGKQLGSCKIETKQRKLDTNAGTDTTYYYYGPDNNPVGTCQGDTTGSFVNLKSRPNICKPSNFQTECDPIIHPPENGFCATARYDCVIENDDAMGFIKAAYTRENKNYIDIDYFTLRHEKGDMPWGTIMNDSTQITTLEVSPQVKIKLSNKMVNGSLQSGEYSIGFEEFKEIFKHDEDIRKSNPWKISAKSGVVVEIAENFRS
jgi:hypothetical protein